MTCLNVANLKIIFKPWLASFDNCVIVDIIFNAAASHHQHILKQIKLF